MTAEETAEAIVRRYDGISEERVSLQATLALWIRDAIRQAEASARNEALEEAAVALETGITETKASGGVATSRSPWAASVARNLKTKD